MARWNLRDDACTAGKQCLPRYSGTLLMTEFGRNRSNGRPVGVQGTESAYYGLQTLRDTGDVVEFECNKKYVSEFVVW